MTNESTPLEYDLFIKGTPTSACRPRVTVKGTFYNKNYTAWRKEANKQVEEYIKSLDEFYTISGPVKVGMLIVMQRPKKASKPYPRGDVDNYAKGPLDVLTKSSFWLDDAQVINLQVEKVYSIDSEQVGVYIHVEETETNEDYI